MKKLYFLFLIALVALGLAACGDTAQNAGSGNWLEGKRFASSASESEIQDWINGLQ